MIKVFVLNLSHYFPFVFKRDIQDFIQIADVVHFNLVESLSWLNSKRLGTIWRGFPGSENLSNS